jgi:amino acid transporter
VSTFIVWASISFMHIRFRQAWKTQGRTTSELPFRALWYPYNAYFGLAANIILALVQGWTTLSPFDAGNFVDAYILLPIFPLIWILFKVFGKSHIKRLDEIDLDEGRRADLDVAKHVVVEDSTGARKNNASWTQQLLRSI